MAVGSISSQRFYLTHSSTQPDKVLAAAAAAGATVTLVLTTHKHW